MKASVLHQYGGPDQLKYEDFPDPKAGDGEVLVRVTATSINPVDWKMRSGAAKERFPLDFPAVLGRDIAGVVRETGPNVKGFGPGDYVMALGSASYAELAVVKASQLTRIPDGLDITTASALPLVVSTGEQLISRGANLQPGQTVLVSGAVGSVGRVAVYAALQLGAKVIAGVRKSQITEAKELGAMQVVALDDQDSVDSVGQLDAVADTVGGKVGAMLLGRVKDGGTFATTTAPPENSDQHAGVKVNRMMAEPDPSTLEKYAKAVREGKFKLPIGRMFPLSEAGEAQSLAEKGGVGKVLLLP